MMEDVALYAIGLFQVWFTPYAKVEESFNLQACHDLLYHGVNLTQYDHFEFPGVVPRTFLGALPVALLSSPFLHFLRPSKPAMQILVRSSLWTLSFLAWRTFKQTISTLHGCDTGVWFTLVSMVQFHVVYYMSRTLPNTFALMLVFVAYSFWMKNQPKAFIALMSISTIVFRGDTAVLFAPILLSMLVTRQISFVMTIATGVLSTVVALATTIVVDSFFWQRWLWPEGEVLWFNTVLNKSHEWGTHPFHWYFASALPRIMLTTVLLLPLGATSLGSVVSGSKSIPEMIQTLRAAAFVDSATCKYFVPVVLYVFLFSFLPHKELRFVLNAVPMLNYVAAVGATKVWRNRTKNRWPVVVALGSIVLTLAGSVVFTLASHANYPGGVAFQRLHELTSTVQHIPKTVHIDVAAAMTGVSRFGEQSSTWTYVKTEGFNTTAHFAPFDYLLTADPSHPSKKEFVVVGVVDAFDRVDFRRLAIVTKAHVYILQRMEL